MSAYYDRSLPEPLFRHVRPGGGLDWLPGWLRSPKATERRARVEFRRNLDDHKHGALMVYMGRTRTLVVIGSAGGEVEVDAADAYKYQRPGIFGRRAASAVRGLKAELQSFLNDCRVGDDFLEGEGAVQGAFARRYTICHVVGEPLIVDTEVRLGFATAGGLTGTAHRNALHDRLRSEHPTFVGTKSTPTKLDAAAILPSGDLGVIELKKEKGDVAEAVRQVAAHVFAFPILGATVIGGVHKLVAQKVESGFLPGGRAVLRAHQPIPIVAAPDSDPQWVARWRLETEHLRKDLAPLLGDLRFWRLSDSGDIAEDVRA